MKPVRTSSGVTPVTVLTKPFPCPGECIFCPNDVRMPKSYLSDEPGAQRAEQNSFDPYLQTMSRLTAYYNTGHPTDKIEVIVLGGTWSFYPETYQIWFVKRIFDALHDFGAGVNRSAEVTALLREASQLHPDRNTINVQLHGDALAQNYNQVVQTVYNAEMRRSREISAQVRATAEDERSPVDEYATWDELEAAQRFNESAPCRCVGLVIETRPDHISVEEVLRVRRLGCTKVQIGFQSLNDAVLRANRRGHTVAATRRAVKLLRQAGFKIHAHWMPNLYGSSPELDVADYANMFADPDFRPDELKIYPCSLIESAELMQRYEDGSWRPYTHDELLNVLVECFRLTPEYCRLTRVIRDIPGTDIVERQPGDQFPPNRRRRTGEARRAQRRYSRAGGAPTSGRRRTPCTWTNCVTTPAAGARCSSSSSPTSARLPGFCGWRCRTLAQPHHAGTGRRRHHPRGPRLRAVGRDRRRSAEGRAQHAGLGTRLIERAAEIAQAEGYARLAVISAVGTRDYYRKRGFADGDLYQIMTL